MKKFSIVTAFLCIACTANGTTGQERWRAFPGNLRSDNRNEANVRELYQGFTDAWNKHDAKAMAGMFAVDGDYLDPDGRLARGRDEVEKVFTQGHATAFKASRLKLNVDTVWFITSAVALLDGSYEVTGVRDLEGKDLPPRKGHLTSVLLEENGRWWIAASRLMVPVPLPYRK